MPNIIHRAGIKGNVNEIYNALTTNEGLARWWTTDTKGAGGIGSTIKFRFNGGGPDFEVIDLQENSLIKWKHSGEMPPAWIDTEISFKLTTEDEQTIVLFMHSNWKESSDFMDTAALNGQLFY